jgi:tetratricopeptide (TPR) repeat protein
MPEPERPRLQGDAVEVIASLAMNCLSQGQLNDAAVLFRGLAAMNNNHYGEAGLGAIAMAQEPPDLDTALEHFTRAGQIQPSDPAIHANRAEILLRKGNLAEAATAYQTVLRLDPNGTTSAGTKTRAILQANRRLSELLRTIER